MIFNSIAGNKSLSNKQKQQAVATQLGLTMLQKIIFNGQATKFARENGYKIAEGSLDASIPPTPTVASTSILASSSAPSASTTSSATKKRGLPPKHGSSGSGSGSGSSNRPKSKSQHTSSGISPRLSIMELSDSAGPSDPNDPENELIPVDSRDGFEARCFTDMDEEQHTIQQEAIRRSRERSGDRVSGNRRVTSSAQAEHERSRIHAIECARESAIRRDIHISEDAEKMIADVIAGHFTSTINQDAFHVRRLRSRPSFATPMFVQVMQDRDAGELRSLQYVEKQEMLLQHAAERKQREEAGASYSSHTSHAGSSPVSKKRASKSHTESPRAPSPKKPRTTKKQREERAKKGYEVAETANMFERASALVSYDIKRRIDAEDPDSFADDATRRRMRRENRRRELIQWKEAKDSATLQYEKKRFQAPQEPGKVLVSDLQVGDIVEACRRFSNRRPHTKKVFRSFEHRMLRRRLSTIHEQEEEESCS